MSRLNDLTPEYESLLAAACREDVAPEELKALEQMADDPDSMRLLADYLQLNTDLQWLIRRQSNADKCLAMLGIEPLHDSISMSGFDDSEAVDPSLVVPTLSPTPSSLFVGGPVFSYMVASVILCMMLLGGWVYKISDVSSLPGGMANNLQNRQQYMPVAVGQVTGMKDCRWGKDEPGTIIGASVLLGRKYSLESGLLQITYKTGANVILEGPCQFKADSDAGGYLQQGRLVARVEKKVASGQWPVASAKPQASSDPQSLIPNPPFTVTTPTTVVTDLGTEFGVEVGENGATTSHVFQGIVELKLLSGAGAVRLIENESARVEPNHERIIPLCREKARPEAFARSLRRRTPIRVFSTGRGLPAGRRDPHWILVSAGNDPTSTTGQAIVVSDVPKSYSPGDRNKSQWISGNGNASSDGAARTFRTSFDLIGTSPRTAVLWGRVMANGRVATIRLNGHPIPTPDLDAKNLTSSSFGDFTASDGFIAGRNILEIDISPGNTLAVPMLRVELEGKSEVFYPVYKFVDLSLKRRDCKATCINDNGLVSGYLKVGYGKIPLIYNSESSDPHAVLLSLQQNVNASVRDCNNAGQLVGCTFIGNDESVAAACVLSEKTGLIRLPGSEAYKISEAWAINNAGIIVGEFTTYEDTVHSFVNSGDNRMTNIGGLGGKVSHARDINDAGWIVGFSTLPGDGKEHSYLYDGKEMIDLGTGEGVTSRALGLNNSGTVAGYFSDSSNGDHAHAYRCDGRAEQPALHRIESLGAYSIAYDINDSGMVVGCYWDGEDVLENYRAFIFIHGKMHDLNGLVSLPPGCTLRIARSINNSGMIAAWGTNWGGREIACLLTPVEDIACQREVTTNGDLPRGDAE